MPDRRNLVGLTQRSWAEACGVPTGLFGELTKHVIMPHMDPFDSAASAFLKYVSQHDHGHGPASKK